MKKGKNRQKLQKEEDKDENLADIFEKQDDELNNIRTLIDNYVSKNGTFEMI